MKRIFALILSAFALVVFSLPALAAEPLVDADWVKDHLGKPGIVMVDIRGDGIAFAKGRVPGSVMTHYGRDGWRVKNAKGVAGVLPEVSKLETLIGNLGISNDDHVVLLPLGVDSGEMAAATRIYWTFKYLGHEQISILNGGILAYAADPKAIVQSGPFTKPEPAKFTAKVNADLLATEADVQAALANKNITLIDNRPTAQHLGLKKSGSVKAFGTIPGSASLPAIDATLPRTGVFKTDSTFRNMNLAAGIDTKADTINFCNTGHWASLGWFISSEILGNKKARLYDGSMAEWTMNPVNPVIQKEKPLPVPKPKP